MENEKKDTNSQQLLLMKIQTVLIACILAFMIIAGITVVKEFKSIQGCIDMIAEKVETIDIDALNDAVEAFTEAADQFNRIDMNELNDTVSALDSAAQKLQEVNIDSLNSLVGALEGAASRLQNAVNAITGIFGR